MLERIANGRTDLIFDWLDQGGAADAETGRTSIAQWCAYYGDVSALRHLLSHGVTLDALGADFGLNGAAFHGHWQLCAFLIEQGADPNRALEDTGEVPLHAALCRFESVAHQRVVEVLVANGADPNRATIPGVATGCYMRDIRTWGETPLHRAAACGTAGSITALIAAGARLDARDANGESPLGWASRALRVTAILRLLLFDDHHIHPDREQMSVSLIGRP